MSSKQVQSPNVTGTRAPLNERDALHLGALQRHWKSNRAFPSMARLQDVLCLNSEADVLGALGRLTATGYLELAGCRIAPAARFFERPVLSEACSSVPLYAGQGSHESLNLDDYLVDDPARTTLHRVHGDHLRDAGILNGDLLVVELHAPAQPGDIVFAVSEGCLTVNTLRRSAGGGYFLEPVHPESDPNRPEPTLQVLGVVIGVARRLRRSTAAATLVRNGAATS